LSQSALDAKAESAVVADVGFGRRRGTRPNRRIRTATDTFDWYGAPVSFHRDIETQERTLPCLPIEIVALLALVGYAIYRQTSQHEVLGTSRFTLAIIYAIARVLIGGFSRPDTRRRGACRKPGTQRCSQDGLRSPDPPLGARRRVFSRAPG
jgi:hypothetical protein